MSIHAQLLAQAGGLSSGGDPSIGPTAGSFPWFMPPVFPPWATNAPKFPPLQAILSQCIGLPLPSNLATLSTVLPVVNLGNGSALNHGIVDSRSINQMHAHPLNLGVQNIPQNLSSRHDREEDSTSSDDEIRRQSAEVLRVKAEEILRNSEN